jgi:hypothetical protein
MPWANNPLIQSLRMQYNAALTAHKSSERALLDARMMGTTPSIAMVEAEAKTRASLEEVRGKLLAAMTIAITGNSEADPPAQT